MRKIYLEGPLGQKFGEEWELNVKTPAEALAAIMAQRPGMRQFLAESQGIQGYEVLIDNEPIESLDECLITDNSMTQSYSFVPVIAGSKNSMLMMVLGVTLIGLTGGLASFGIGSAGGIFGGANAAAAGLVGQQVAGAAVGTMHTMATAVAATSGASLTGMLAMQGMGYMGMAMLLGGAAMMLAPDVPDGSAGESADNYLFGGPVNTVKQGEPIPLVYGRIITGSKTVSASLFTQTSRQKITAGRKMVGIPNFRTDGSKTVANGATQGAGYQDRRGRGGPRGGGAYY